MPDPIRLTGEISKIDEDQRLVFGWASVVEVGGEALVDKQGDVISEADMEQMAYRFAEDYRDASEMHVRAGVGKMVESMAFTREKQKALGIDLGKSAWWVGFRITDDKTWAGVKSGQYPMFSIEGVGDREAIA